MRTLLIFLTLAALLVACGSNDASSTGRTSAEGIASSGSATQDAPEKEVPLGQATYVKNCGTCHQMDGAGVPGLYPPLASDWVTGDEKRLIGVILNGQQGEIMVNGEKWNGAMPAFGYLKDEEVAALLTYIRQNFGNQASAITAQQVAAAR